MNEPKAMCPQCHREVVFVKIAWFKRCPECGFRYTLHSPAFARGTEKADEVASVTSIVLKVALIMAALVVVGVGVLFGGCLVMSGPH